MLDSKRITAVIFDLDGLLVDSEPIWFKVEQQLVAELGFEWTHALAAQCLGQGTRSMLRFWQDTFAVALDLDVYDQRLIDHMVAAAPAMLLHAGVNNVLTEVRRRQWPAAVASSSPLRLIRAAVSATGIGHHFAHLVSGQEVKNGKPAPDVFLLAAQRLGAPPEQCLVFEDALAGVRAAHAAGMQVVAVPSTEQAEIKDWATLVVPQIDAVLTSLSSQ